MQKTDGKYKKCKQSLHKIFMQFCTSLNIREFFASFLKGPVGITGPKAKIKLGWLYQ
jgi:hypothetical protein